MMDFLSKFIPKRFRKDKNEGDRQNVTNEKFRENVAKERANMKQSFAVYCNAHHGTGDGKLCPKCTALLAIIFPKMARCRYGITKPVCDKCDEQCFGDVHNKEFMEIMGAASKKMLVKHPMMTVRHKFMKMGVDYAKKKQADDAAEKAEAKRKAKLDKKKARAKSTKK